MATRSKTKAAARKANADKRPHAVARYVRISSRKAKIVLDLIRGKKADEAQAIPDGTPVRVIDIRSDNLLVVEKA